ncbi:UNVERIFIED_CONTAM: LINE-1 retrotransposable element O protein [Sesamum radiatum]|uniref:LINE-1 retrotransposable element O protein n=1 Tax=Sesamum radiatum TaxID=300843 RepID=A0AAW2Q0A8_SESRA
MQQQKCFRFEAVWLRSKECKGVIEQAWASRYAADPTQSLLHKIRSCKEDITCWDRTGLGNITKRIKDIESILKAATQSEITRDVQTRNKALQAELEELLEREETLWRQRGKALWLKEGDRNIAFFHAQATERRHRKEIKKLKNHAGVEVSGSYEIQDIIVEYFSNIFMSTSPDGRVIDGILACLETRVTEEMNTVLCRPFTPEEVKCALDAMHPLKSPGPDGMSPIFYQKFWSIIGTDVSRCALQILNEHVLDKDLNHTHIVLLPKCTSPVLVLDFCPISLCNVVYKLASKTIANRLKPLLNTLISNSQSAFVLGHVNLDNVLVAYEVNHYLAHKYQGDSGYVSLKLDLSKAYDRVEWYFLE